jgi:formylglycine-generating enzyme required for sulfatase activity
MGGNRTGGNRRRIVLTVLLAQGVAGACGGWSLCGPATYLDEKSGMEFVQLPGGTFNYGCEPQDTQCRPNEKPGKSVTVAPFWMTRTVVTEGAYKKCVDAKMCTTIVPPARDAFGLSQHCVWGPQAHEDEPMNCIDWGQAKQFCEWTGGRLPTSEEWEYAAKGGESRIYPWGDDPPDDRKANFGRNKAGNGFVEADARSAGASKHGLLQMVGNVNQWVDGKIENEALKEWQQRMEDEGVDPEAFSISFEMREYRGGAWHDPASEMRASRRVGSSPRWVETDVGARCAMNAQAQ